MNRLVTVVVGVVVGVQAGSPSLKARVDVRVERTVTTTTYHYTVRNEGTDTIANVFIGTAEGVDEVELASAPIDWRFQGNDCPRSIVVPSGWRACVGTQEDSANYFLEIESVNDRARLVPGASLRVAVTLARPDPTYETATFWAIGAKGYSDQGKVTAIGRVR